VQDAHSIYFQVMAEHGFLGFGLYIALIAGTLLSLRSTMRRAKRRPELKFYFNAAQMIEVSILAFLTAGAFLSMSYFDLFYHLVAITVLLQVLVTEKLMAPAPDPAPAAAGSAVRVPARGPLTVPAANRALSVPRPRPLPRP
jgi:O-antigen ligase